MRRGGGYSNYRSHRDAAGQVCVLAQGSERRRVANRPDGASDQAERDLAPFRVLPVRSAVAIEFDRLRANRSLRKIGRADLLDRLYRLGLSSLFGYSQPETFQSGARFETGKLGGLNTCCGDRRTPAVRLAQAMGQKDDRMLLVAPCHLDARPPMTFPVTVQLSEGSVRSRARRLVRSAGHGSDTRANACRTGIGNYQAIGSSALVALEVRRRGLTGLFGKYRDDPTLREICDAAYRDARCRRTGKKAFDSDILTEILAGNPAPRRGPKKRKKRKRRRPPHSQVSPPLV